MNKRRPQSSFPDPFLGWGLLALQAAEMMVASSQVIHHRTRRRNNPAQLFEMGNEKVQAAIESSHAMARTWMRFGAHPGPAAWAALFTSGLAPFHSRSLSNARRARRR